MKKVFLGGTCNNSHWRDHIIPMLEIDYFNPVVKDWDEVAYQRELEERETADFCLYTITPKMTGVYSIAEVVDDSNKRPEKTILIILREDYDLEGNNPLRFDDGQWKSLNNVVRMVRQNGGQTFTYLKAAAEWMNEQV